MNEHNLKGVKTFCILKGVESAFLTFYYSVVLFFVFGFSGTNPSKLILLLTLIAVGLFAYVKHLFYLKNYREGARKLTLCFDILLICFACFLLNLGIRESIYKLAIIVIPLVLHILSLIYFNLRQVKEAFKSNANEFNDDLKEISIRRWVLGTVLIVIAVLVWHSIATDKHLRKHLSYSLVEPIPKSLKIISGQCGHWLDPSAYIQFAIDKNDWVGIITGYELAPFDKYRTPDLKKYFDSKDNIEHYYREDNKGRNCHLYWDEDNGKALFQTY